MATATVVRIAWRNLWRNRRRTALALAAIGLSVALVLVYDGVLRGYGDWMLGTITGPMLGHVQVHHPEWRKTRAIDATVRNVRNTLDAVRASAEVTGATARVYAPALAASGEEGFGVIVLGIDLAEESRPGRLLDGVAISPEPRHILMGRLLAERMHVSAGDEIAIVGEGADGSLANDLFRVATLVNTSVDFVNREAVIMPIAVAQELFALGDEAHELIIYGRDPARAGVLAGRLAAMPELAGAEVLPWESISPGMRSLLGIVEAAWMFVLVLVLIAAAAGVANTMLMATFERTHEFGMLLALGTAPGRIVAMIVLESLALGVAGVVLGGAVGAVLVEWAHRTGVDYAALTGGGPRELSAFGLNWSLILYPRLAMIDLLRVAVAVLATSTIASIWPATRAARLEPARALRD